MLFFYLLLILCIYKCIEKSYIIQFNLAPQHNECVCIIWNVSLKREFIFAVAREISNDTYLRIMHRNCIDDAIEWRSLSPARPIDVSGDLPNYYFCKFSKVLRISFPFIFESWKKNLNQLFYACYLIWIKDMKLLMT